MQFALPEALPLFVEVVVTVAAVVSMVCEVEFPTGTI